MKTYHLFLILLLFVFESCNQDPQPAKDPDITILKKQLQGSGCSYLGTHNSLEHACYSIQSSFLSTESDKQCFHNPAWISTLSPGRIGCRRHALICLDKLNENGDTLKAELHEILTLDEQDYDYAGNRAENLKEQAVLMLAESGDDAVLSFLEERLRQRKGSHHVVLEAMRKLKVKAKPLASLLRGELKKDVLDSPALLEVLELIDPASNIEVLEEALHHDNPKVRFVAMKHLKVQKPDAIEEVLLESLTKVHSALDTLSLLTEKQLDSSRVQEILIGYLSKERDSLPVLKLQLGITERLQDMSDLSKPVCHALRENLKTKNAVLWIASAETLMNACSTEDRSILFQELIALEYYKRQAVIRMIAKSRLPQSQKKALLEPLRDDMDSSIRKLVKKELLPGKQNETGEHGVQTEVVTLPEYYLHQERQKKLAALFKLWDEKTRHHQFVRVEVNETRHADPPPSAGKPGKKVTIKKGTIEMALPSKRRMTLRTDGGNGESVYTKIDTPRYTWDIKKYFYEDAERISGFHYEKPKTVSTEPLVYFRVYGAVKHAHGVSATISHQSVTTSYSYLGTSLEGGKQLHKLGLYTRWNSYLYWIDEQGFIHRIEKYYGGGDSSNWYLESSLDIPFEVHEFYNPRFPESMDSHLFSYHPPRNATGTITTFTADGRSVKKEL